MRIFISCLLFVMFSVSLVNAQLPDTNDTTDITIIDSLSVDTVSIAVVDTIITNTMEIQIPKDGIITSFIVEDVPNDNGNALILNWTIEQIEDISSYDILYRESDVLDWSLLASGLTNNTIDYIDIEFGIEFDFRKSVYDVVFAIERSDEKESAAILIQNIADFISCLPARASEKDLTSLKALNIDDPMVFAKKLPSEFESDPAGALQVLQQAKLQKIMSKYSSKVQSIYKLVVHLKDAQEVFSDEVGPIKPKAQIFNTSRINILVCILVVSMLILWFTWQAETGKDLFIRRIPGLSALGEAIGRATEMGRPVLYVPGIAEIDNIQTIASIVILKEVSKVTADYDTPIIVTCRFPMVMTAAEEMVKQAYMEVGKPDSFRPDDVRFIASEQFAFAAGVDGIMVREKPAANIFLGAFWAESLVLAETGFATGAIQIAGTANVSQLPFFVAACDYTLIGEELYAASAYLSKEPKLLGSLKGSDWAKVIIIIISIISILLTTFENPTLGDWFATH